MTDDSNQFLSLLVTIFLGLVSQEGIIEENEGDGMDLDVDDVKAETVHAVAKLSESEQVGPKH